MKPSFLTNWIFELYIFGTDCLIKSKTTIVYVKILNFRKISEKNVEKKNLRKHFRELSNESLNRTRSPSACYSITVSEEDFRGPLKHIITKIMGCSMVNVK